MKNPKREQQECQIPNINRDGPLITRLLPIVLIGVDNILDRESQLYLRLLCRLVDKSFNEYSIAREYIEKERKTKNKLENRFIIIDHLEDCLNAINRAAKIFNCLINGILIKGKTIKKNYNILSFISNQSIKKIKKYDVSKIRNRVEHIDEDIYSNKFNTGLFLDIDANYKKVCINKKCLTLCDLASMIEDYHKVILEICGNLPNRIENGKYFYNKR